MHKAFDAYILFDTMSSFHKYFSVSSFDRAWGIFVTSAGHNMIKPGALYPSAGHPPEYQFGSNEGRILDQFLLLMIGAGQGTLETHASKSIEVTAGDMILIPAGTLHRYHPDPATGWEEYWVCFNGSLPEQWQRNRLFKRRTPLLGREMSFAVRDRFDELITVARLENYSPQVLASLTHAVLSEALYEGSAKGSVTSEIEAMRRAADTIRKHPDQYDIAAFAHAAGMSERSFQRAFNSHFGMSLSKFAQEERITHAKRWLTETKLPLRTISERLHFSSEFYFMRAFKRSTGKSPGIWRTQARRNVRHLSSNAN